MHRHFVAELISHIALVEMKLTKRSWLGLSSTTRPTEPCVQPVCRRRHNAKENWKSEA